MQLLKLLAIFIFMLVFAPGAGAASLIQDVPFTSQAPFGNWASPWQDFCEEAVVVMAAHFVKKLPLNPKLADQEMRIIKMYEELRWGRYKDTNAEETAEILQVLFGIKNVRLEENPTIDSMKKELSSGNILIVPVAGRMLKNPYFTPPGPLYHMVLIKGFDDTHFITNDPGTRRGNGLKYKQELLFDAIHDWNNGDVLSGGKVMIVVGR